jgi:hypothetical protein
MPDQEEKIILYDNVADPCQLENVAQDQPEIVQQLIREELTPWLRRTGDPWAKRLQPAREKTTTE